MDWLQLGLAIAIQFLYLKIRYVTARIHLIGALWEHMSHGLHCVATESIEM